MDRLAIRPALQVLAVLTTLLGATSFLVWYIHAASTDVVYADTWAYMGMIEHYLSDQLSFMEVLSPHNENRTVVLNLALLFSAEHDSLNLVHIEYLSAMFAILTILALIMACRRMFGRRHTTMAALCICVTLLMSSLVQWENLLLPINFVFVSAAAFSVLSIVLMNRHLMRPDPRLLSAEFLGSVVLSELALLSMGGGVVVWGINSLQIALSSLLHRTRTRSALGT